MAHASEDTPASSPRGTALEQRFLEHRERDVSTIISAMQRDDFETIGRLGHNMRGTGPSYGFPELGAIGEMLEAAANDQDIGSIGEQLDALSVWIARTRARVGER